MSTMPLSSSGEFSFRVELPTNSCCCVLVSVTVFAFYFQVPMWLSSSPMRAQLLGFAPLQPFRITLWQACVPPGDGLWPTLRVQCVATPSTASSRGTSCYSFSCPPYLINIVGHEALGTWYKSPNQSASST